MNTLINKKDILKIIELLNFEKKQLNKKNIVISGAFGFIGKYILQTLINLKKIYNIEFSVYTIDNFITSDKTFVDYFVNEGVIFLNHDINEELKIDVNFDYLISLAGIASPYYYNAHPMKTLDVSINGLKNMFRLHHNMNSKFVFFSSSEIYGDPPLDQIPTKETYRGNVTSIGPRSCYDESKRVGETICYINSKYYGKKTSIIRPFNVFGPGTLIEDYRIIPNITRALIYKEELKIYDKGNQTRTYCYITDAIKGFFSVIFKDEMFGVYNIGNDQNEISVLELVKVTEQVMNTKLNYKITQYPKSYPPDQPQRRCPDISSARKNLKYEPKVSLQEGLKRHFDFSIDVFKK